MKKLIILIFITGLSLFSLSAQKYGVKHNLTGDAFLSPNIAFEVGLSQKYSLEVYGAFSPFGSDKKRFKHLYIQPEFRYWFCESFNGTYIGVHAIGGQFSVAGKNWPLLLTTFDNNRYEGEMYGGGFSIGHHWILNKRWSLEANFGIGYIYFNYDKYKCANCSPKEKSDGWNYVGPTKAAVSLIYMIK